MNILITGGAGFVGSSIALHFKHKYPNAKITAFDNLKRRGSEINLQKFKENKIDFVHGDIRNPSDFEFLKENWDLFFECSAEPSVLAGLNSSPKYLLETNLVGTINCLEFARQYCDRMIFMSTSRVYSIVPLREINLTEKQSRFEVAPQQTLTGISSAGISENFPIDSSRSLYGTSKLASEFLVQEYASTYGLKSIINRCGVIAGPGQFGKVDQGVFTLWVARHYFKQGLKYTGFGGTGKQVRDLLHVEDLMALLENQTGQNSHWDAQTYNVGGGNTSATSLIELTEICREITGNSVPIGQEATTTPVDIPWYISNNAKVESSFSWKPKRNVKDIVVDISKWLRTNEALLKNSFC